MIAPTQLRNMLSRERTRFRRLAPTDFTRGVIYGLEIATFGVDEICKKSSILRSEYLATLNRWSAAAFYQAIKTALNYLSNGDIKRATQRLKKALEGVRNGHKTATASTRKNAPVQTLRGRPILPS